MRKELSVSQVRLQNNQSLGKMETNYKVVNYINIGSGVKKEYPVHDPTVAALLIESLAQQQLTDPSITSNAFFLLMKDPHAEEGEDSWTDWYDEDSDDLEFSIELQEQLIDDYKEASENKDYLSLRVENLYQQRNRLAIFAAQIAIAYGSGPTQLGKTGWYTDPNKPNWDEDCKTVVVIQTERGQVSYPMTPDWAKLAQKHLPRIEPNSDGTWLSENNALLKLLKQDLDALRNTKK